MAIVPVVLPPWPAMRPLPEAQARKAWRLDYAQALLRANGMTPEARIDMGFVDELAALTFSAAANDEGRKKR